MLEADTEDNLQRLFVERGWTDGLPIILPTEERVAEMLAGTRQPPDKLVGKAFMVDTQENLRITVETVAIAAVMAGARPEHLPVLLAIASTGQPAIQPSTLPFASALLVNGPIRNEIGMNSGMGALGPYNLANAVIGRAWTLMSIVWGYARRKRTFWTSQGNNYTYNNLCMAENEERSVWEPFHVQKGHKREESVVSLFRGWNLLNSTGAAARRSWGEEVKLQMQALPALYSGATLILDPMLAGHLKENEGFQTPLEVGRWISENVKMTGEPVLEERHYRHAGGAAGAERRAAVCRVEATPRRRPDCAVSPAGEDQHPGCGRRNKSAVENFRLRLHDDRVHRQVAVIMWAAYIPG